MSTPSRRSVCCARAASGHAAAAPPSSVMNSRRRLSNIELPAPWVPQALGTALTAGPCGRPEPFGIVPERPSLHEVTISHPPGVDFSAQCRGGSHLPLAMSGPLLPWPETYLRRELRPAGGRRQWCGFHRRTHLHEAIRRLAPARAGQSFNDVLVRNGSKALQGGVAACPSPSQKPDARGTCRRASIKSWPPMQSSRQLGDELMPFWL